MALTLETGLRSAIADAIDTYVNAGTAPELVFETSGDTEVATIVLDATNAFGAASSGVITMTGQPIQDTNATGGTVAQFSIYRQTAAPSHAVTAAVVNNQQVYAAALGKLGRDACASPRANDGTAVCHIVA
jgi:hypothetical protein